MSFFTSFFVIAVVSSASFPALVWQIGDYIMSRSHKRYYRIWCCGAGRQIFSDWYLRLSGPHTFKRMCALEIVHHLFSVCGLFLISVCAICPVPLLNKHLFIYNSGHNGDSIRCVGLAPQRPAEQLVGLALLWEILTVLDHLVVWNSYFSLTSAWLIWYLALELSQVALWARLLPRVPDVVSATRLVLHA